MASWLGGLGSGLGQSLGQVGGRVGGSLSSLTGQISSFTKDILLEGTEEVKDAATELHVSNSRVKELEIAYTALKSEYERQKKFYADLEEKHEASELQIKQQSSEYRNQLAQKEVEISHLKARQNALQEQLQKLQTAAPSSQAGVGVAPTTSDSAPYITSVTASGFHGSDVDFGDVLWSQQEINKLSNHVFRLEEEVAHWKQIAEKSTKSEGTANADQSEMCKLQKTIKDLKEKLSQERDEHQHELSVLQDAHRHKLAELTRRHREELTEYEERIEELEELQSGEAGVPESNHTKVMELQRTIQSLEGEATISKQEAQELEQQLQNLGEKVHRLEEENARLYHEAECAKSEKAQITQDYNQLQMDFDLVKNILAEQQSLVKELHENVNQKMSAEEENTLLQLQKALSDAEAEIARLNRFSKLEHETKMVESEETKNLKAAFENMKEENEQLHKEKDELQMLLQKLNVEEKEMAAQNIMNDSVSLELNDLKQKLNEKDSELNQLVMEKNTLLTELEELDRQNQEVTQHFIAVKDQLVQQCHDSETVTGQLRVELDGAKKQVAKTEAEKKSLLQEVEGQKEKLSQSAFTLNDLHMSHQQLLSEVKDLTEQQKILEKQNADMKKETSELRTHLKKAEEQLSAAVGKVTESEKAPMCNHDNLIQEKETEILELKKEISENKYLKTAFTDAKIENKKLNSALQDVQQQLQESLSGKGKLAHEKDTIIKALRLEKSQIENELNQAEKKIVEQSQKYEETIEELTRTRNMDTTALHAEHERLIKANQEKDFEIADLKQNIKQLETDHEETKEMLTTSLEGQKQLTDIINEKEKFLDKLKGTNSELQKELASYVKMAKEFVTLKKALDEKDKCLGVMKEENSHLKEEIDHLKDQQSKPQPVSEPKTLDIITELEAEKAQLNVAKNALENEINTYKKTVEDQKKTIGELRQSINDQKKETDEAKVQHEQMVLNYEKLLSEKADEINCLQEMVDQVKSQLQKNTDVIDTGSSDVFQETKTQTVSGENGNEKHDLSKVEIERLLKGIREKELEIKLLNEKNVSLSKQIDQLSSDEVGKLTQIIQQKEMEIQSLYARVTSGSYLQDVAYLQQQLQAYGVERDQLLAVLNEKTRENSHLKTEYHRILDTVAIKEAAVLKLREENEKLSSRHEIGSQEMVRETIQNLSRIIREKDIEIDALSQKCQTLLTVLQTSSTGPGCESGGVSSNQFEELLRERDDLKQQVKKMEEWKQQVITTIQNMQHESAQLQEEIQKLQGQVFADSDSSSKLQMDYATLINGYEKKEKMLKNLSQELVHIQSSIGQLHSTKDVLLGRLDLVKAEPGTELGSVVPLTETLTSHVPSEAEVDRIKALQKELETLKRVLQSKESTIRTLQENNSRLSDTVAANAESSRKNNEEGTSEITQTREKCDALQISLREKDLLIKSKNDQFISVNHDLKNKIQENEVLKQAVTNLKERNVVLEMEISKLKEENDKIAGHSREKESEFRALQETNMQFSMMLREKEFESSSMKEKASALEQLLKDKEQGKTGELNQLLNEVKSMQEKAVMFQQERDHMMLALKQKQMEASALQNETQHLREKEQRLKQELDRLRSHLIEMEDSYTREALAAEDRETELRKKVTQLDEKLMSSSTAVENASHQASLQVESLQEQLRVIARQRDDAVLQLNTSQEQVKQYALSLANLQMVLEQFQQEEKAMYTSELEKYKKDAREWKRKSEVLEDKVAAMQANLDEANAALESASRLTEQLDIKEELIEDLKNEVHLRQEMLDDAQNKLMNLLNSTEGKVDKVLMRNLFVGYFHTPKNKRHEALRLMGSILGLSRDEVDQLLSEEKQGVTRWVSSWLGGRSGGTKSVPNTPSRAQHETVFNSSFSALFVKFLETESRPTLPPPKMTMQDIVPIGSSATGSLASPTATSTLGKSILIASSTIHCKADF
ncbi:thyroid receptor-interacting protein 11 [Protopterus annectens]|uniref:thyroid receptor-interacting protein 11 n=1 Tax=Protopterus annectens TaxID=7888 RepID=UPI001CF96AA9|nr:thyroid receptor-interacting protein 11 [Protopterus annectens]